MGLLSNFGQWMGNVLGFQMKSTSAFSSSFTANSGGGSYGFDELSLTALYAKHGEYSAQQQRTAMLSAWVSSNVDAISNELSTATLRVKQRDGSKEGKPIHDHPFEQLWHSPSKYVGNTNMMKFIAGQYILWGKNYLFFAPTGKELTEIWPIPAYQIKPIFADPPFEVITHFFWKARSDIKPLGINPEYMLYSRRPSPFNILDGLSPIAAALGAITMDARYQKWNQDFFGEQNGLPTALVTLPKELMDSQVLRFKQEMRDFYGSGQRRIAIARAGEVDFNILSHTLSEMEFHKGREFSRAEIDRAMGIPEGFWDMRANRANADHADSVFIRTCVWPILSLLQEDLNSQIIHQWYGKDFYCEFDDIRIPNVEMEMRRTEVRKAYWKIDELRLADGLNPIGDERGDKLVAEISANTPNANLSLMSM